MAWFSKNKTWIMGTGFFVLSFILRFLSADQTEHPTGWDGYYYVMQVHSWMTFGHMQSGDFSLIYPFFAVTTFITGDPVTGFKIGAALIAALLTISVYYYLIRREIALMIACLASGYLVFSPLVTYFILQFPKNALGLVFFIFFITSLKRPGIPAAILFLCTILIHRMTGAFAIGVIGLYAVRHISWKWLLAGIVAVVTVGFLPGIIHISDLSRLDGQFVWTPHWAPLAFTKIYPTSLDGWFKTDLVLIAFMVIASFGLAFTNRGRFQTETWIWISLAILSIFPFLGFVPGGIGHRFLMIAPVVFTVLLGLFLRPMAIPSTIVIIFFVVASVFSYRSYISWAFDAPNNAYVTIVNRLADRYDPTKYPLAIAHKGLAELIIYKTDFDALNWLPPEDMPQDHVLRISCNVVIADFEKYLSKEDLRDIKGIAPKYHVLPETTWQKFVDAAVRDNKKGVIRRIFSGANPMSKRPYFIGKGKKH